MKNHCSVPMEDWVSINKSVTVMFICISLIYKIMKELVQSMKNLLMEIDLTPLGCKMFVYQCK